MSPTYVSYAPSFQNENKAQNRIEVSISNADLPYAAYSSDKFTAKDKKLDCLKHLEIYGWFDTEGFDVLKNYEKSFRLKFLNVSTKRILI